LVFRETLISFDRTGGADAWRRGALDADGAVGPRKSGASRLPPAESAPQRMSRRTKTFTPW